MKFNTTTYILNLPHPCLKQSWPGGTISHIMVCSKIQKQNTTENQQNKTKQTEKSNQPTTTKKKTTKSGLDSFCKKSTARCKASDIKMEKRGGKKIKMRGFSSVGEVFLQIGSESVTK